MPRELAAQATSSIQREETSNAPLYPLFYRMSRQLTFLGEPKHGCTVKANDFARHRGIDKRLDIREVEGLARRVCLHSR